MPNLKQLLQNQAQKEVTINENFDATSPAATFAVKSYSGLTINYYGGEYPNAAGVRVTYADAALNLTANSTNYVFLNVTTNTIQSSTVPVANGNVWIATVVTNATGISAKPENKRMTPFFPVGAGNSLAGGGGTALTTSKVFQITAVNGMNITVAGGKYCLSTAYVQSGVSIGTVSNTTVTIPTFSSGYIYLRSDNVINFTTSAINLFDVRPLYYVVSDGSKITTLDDLTDSFVNFSFKPFIEIYKDTWAVATEYIQSASFKEFNTAMTTTNLFPQPVMLFCKTAEFGYSQGDQVLVYANPPQVLVRQGACYITTNAVAPQVLNRTAGSVGVPVSITPSRWGILVILKPAQ